METSRDAWIHHPLAMHSSILQPDRPGVRDCDTTMQRSDEYSGSQRDANTTFPRSAAYNDTRHRASARISPPPLKRQRTDSDVPRESLRQTGPTNFPARSCSNPDLVRRSLDGLSISQQRKPDTWQDRDGLWRHSSSFPTLSITQYSETERITVKARNIDALTSATGPRVTVKRACRVCEKSSATNYNPIFNCPGCARPYHDSCRKPPLVDGFEPHRWRCSKCLSGIRARTSTVSSAQREIRNSSAVPSILHSKLDSSPFQKLSDNPSSSSLHSVAEPYAKRVSSFALTHRSSQPLLVQSDRQTEAIPSVVDSRLACTTAKHGKPSDNEDSSRSDASVLNTMNKSKKARSSNSINRRDDSNCQPIPSKSLYTSDHDFAGTLHTPTQRLSPLEISGLLFDPRLANEPETEKNDDNLLTMHRPLTDTIATLTVLCGTCRTKRVFAKNNGETIRCRNCRNRLLIGEAGKLEIPETPDAAQNQAYARQSPKDALSGVSTPMSTSKLLVPWFQSNLVIAKPKIKQKKVGDEVILSTENALRESLLDRYESNESPHVTDTLEQIFVRKEKPSVDVAPHILDKDMQASEASAMEKMKVPIPTEAHWEQQKFHSDLPPPLVYARGNQSDDSNPNLKFITARKYRAYDACDVNMSVQSIEAKIAITSHTDYASPDTRASSEQVVKLPSLETFKKRYTTRELAIIALSAADDSGLVAVEITDWLARTFTHLRKGQGSWETAIKTKLSSLPELCRDKVPGAGQNMQRYSFVDASTRAWYRAEFAEYCNVITTPVSDVAESFGLYMKPRSALKHKGLPQSIKVRKIVSSADDHSPVKPSQTSEAFYATQATPAMLPEGLSTPYMPFERAIKRIPQVDLSVIRDSKRETSYEEFLKAQAWSVESMTEDDRTAKIAQIKARPSRKQFFGSDHRLGHVRRHGRLDIHDESDGAWKPPPWKIRSDHAKGNEDTMMLDGPTLREVFDLPENAIPMNDGQTELAFRDGTKVNGRLPRSRQIYKVGKMFGGELTVRTS